MAGRAGRPTEEDASLASVSYTAAKEPVDLVAPHLVEIVWRRRLAHEETEATCLRADRSAMRRYLYDGFPAFAMVKGSPLDASSASLESRALASWMFTVFTISDHQ
jgi:hypothetical protein